MELIKCGEISAGQILEKIKLGLSTLAHHMKILCDSGIVKARKESRGGYFSVNNRKVNEIVAVMQEWTS